MNQRPDEDATLPEGRRDWGRRMPTVAEAAAEAMTYWLPAAIIAVIASLATYLSLDPVRRGSTANYVICKPTEEIAAVAAATDLAKLIEALDLPPDRTARARFAARADRGSELATLTVTTAADADQASSDLVAEAVVAAANLALLPELDRAARHIDALLEANRRSIEEASALLKGSAASPGPSDSVAILMSQVAMLRTTEASLLDRKAGFRGIRIIGTKQIGSSGASSTRWIATMAAGLGALLAVPAVLRFVRQVANARRALRNPQAH